MSINYFVPCTQYIQSITQSNPATVTTTVPHGYKPGISVRLNIPIRCGMQQLSGNEYQATILGESTFSIPVNTTNFNPFFQTGSQPSLVIPVGESAETLKNAVHNNNNIVPEYWWRN